MDLDFNNIIGNGVHGKVYRLLSSNDKCIKVSTLYSEFVSIKNIEKNIEYIIKNKPEHFVNTYSFNFINYNKCFITFSYVMDLLLPINSNEELVFHTLVSHEDLGKEKDLSYETVMKNVSGLSLGLDFNVGHVIMFCNLLRNSNIKHLDLHQRNIMKDKFGNYKLIDLDNLKIGD